MVDTKESHSHAGHSHDAFHRRDDRVPEARRGVGTEFLELGWRIDQEIQSGEKVEYVVEEACAPAKGQICGRYDNQIQIAVGAD